MIRRSITVETHNGIINISEFRSDNPTYDKGYLITLANNRRSEVLWISGYELTELQNQIQVLLDKSR